MIYLLDADTLIRADSAYYPLNRFPVFWDWLRYNGEIGNVKIPSEQFEDVVVGAGDLVDWLNEQENKDALYLEETPIKHWSLMLQRMDTRRI